MSNRIAKLLYILKEDRRGLAILLTIFVLVSALEAVGIGFVGPFLSLASNPESIQTIPILRWLYDALNVQSSNQFIVIFGLALCVVFVVKSFLYFLSQIYIFKYAFEQQRKVMLKLLKSYLEVPYTFHLKHNTAGLINCITFETYRFCHEMLLPLLTALANIVVLLIIVALLASTNLLFLVMVLGVLLPVFYLFYLMRGKIKHWGREGSVSYEEIIRVVNHSLGGVKETRVIGCEPYFLEQMDHECRRLRDAASAFHSVQKLPRILIEALLVVILVLFVCMFLFGDNREQNLISILGVFAVASIRLMPSAGQFLHSMNQVQNSSYSLDLIYSALKQVEQPPAKPFAKPTRPVFKPEVKADAVANGISDDSVSNGASNRRSDSRLDNRSNNYSSGILNSSSNGSITGTVNARSNNRSEYESRNRSKNGSRNGESNGVLIREFNNTSSYASEQTSGVFDIQFDIQQVEQEQENELALNSRHAPIAGSNTFQPSRFVNQVELKNVSYAYPESSQLALDNICLRLKKGQSIAFIGKSGAGKTTLVDVILGLLLPQSGDIRVDGISVYNDIRAWQQLVGYIPQSIYLTDDTIERNIAFGVPDHLIDRHRLERAIAAAQLTELMQDLPDGVQTVVGERGVRLSGGQRQRVGIARALYHEREILVLDEATSALDNETEASVSEAIQTLSGRKTLVIIAHRLTTVQQCDLVYVLEQGRIIESGSYQKIVLKQ